MDNRIIVVRDKYSYEHMTTDIETLAKIYPGIIKYDVFGKSCDGRSLYEITLGNDDAKNHFLVTASTHGREYITTLIVMKQIEEYAANYHSCYEGTEISHILDAVCLHFVPMLNPDGVSISQYGYNIIRNDDLRYKVKKTAGAADISKWKANARGVDLNRNFKVGWEHTKSPKKPKSKEYKGPYPESEPEIKSVTELTEKIKKSGRLSGAINYHATGSVIFNAYMGNEQCRADCGALGRAVRELTGYDLNGETNEICNSGFKDYLITSNNVPCITIEVGKGKCPISMKEWSSIWNKNKYVSLKCATVKDIKNSYNI